MIETYNELFRLPRVQEAIQQTIGVFSALELNLAESAYVCKALAVSLCELIDEKHAHLHDDDAKNASESTTDAQTTD